MTTKPQKVRGRPRLDPDAAPARVVAYLDAEASSRLSTFCARHGLSRSRAVREILARALRNEHHVSERDR